MSATTTADITGLQQRAAVSEGRRLRQAAAAEYLGYSESTLEKKRLTGGGPPFIKLAGSGRVVYDTRDLDTWLAERRVTSTSQRPGPAPAPARIERRRVKAQPRKLYRTPRSN
jgi:Helix-turn-helix domain